MADRSRVDDLSTNDAQASMYNTEHWLAWIVGFAGAAMAVIGLLIGFDVISWNALEADGETGGGLANPNFWEGLLWIMGGISLYMLSAALHQTQHHVRHSRADDKNRGIKAFEHSMAWLTGLVALVTLAIGLLVAFDVFGDSDNNVFDGLLWMFVSFGASIFTLTLHNVGHHDMLGDEDYILSVVDSRRGAAVSDRGTIGAREREPGVERRT